MQWCFITRENKACSFTYSLMYRFGDDVILPLVEKCRLEESLASLLVTRGTDLSYEQVSATAVLSDPRACSIQNVGLRSLEFTGPTRAQRA